MHPALEGAVQERVAQREPEIPVGHGEFGDLVAGERHLPYQRIALVAPWCVQGQRAALLVRRPPERLRTDEGVRGARRGGRPERVGQPECRRDQAVHRHQMPHDTGRRWSPARPGARPRTSAAAPEHATPPRPCHAAARPVWRSPRRTASPTRGPGYGPAGGPGSPPARGSAAADRGRGCRRGAAVRRRRAAAAPRPRRRRSRSDAPRRRSSPRPSRPTVPRRRAAT